MSCKTVSYSEKLQPKPFPTIFISVFHTFREMEMADHKMNSWGKMCCQLLPVGQAKLSSVFFKLN